MSSVIIKITLGKDPGGLGGGGGTGDGGGGEGTGMGSGTGAGVGVGTGLPFLMPQVQPSLEDTEELSLVKKHFPLSWYVHCKQSDDSSHKAQQLSASTSLVFEMMLPPAQADPSCLSLVHVINEPLAQLIMMLWENHTILTMLKFWI